MNDLNDLVIQLQNLCKTNFHLNLNFEIVEFHLYF